MSVKRKLIPALLVLPVLLAAGDKRDLQLLIAAPSEVTAGGAVQVTATLTNVSDHEIQSVQISGDPIAAYRFRVQDAHHFHDAPKKNNIDEDQPPPVFSFNSITLQPGQQFTETIDLSEVYDLTEPGVYTVDAERYIPADLGFSFTVSNKIKIEIERTR
jgi:hypothetical protein